MTLLYRNSPKISIPGEEQQSSKHPAHSVQFPTGTQPLVAMGEPYGPSCASRDTLLFPVKLGLNVTARESNRSVPAPDPELSAPLRMQFPLSRVDAAPGLIGPSQPAASEYKNKWFTPVSYRNWHLFANYPGLAINVSTVPSAAKPFGSLTRN